MTNKITRNFVPVTKPTFTLETPTALVVFAFIFGIKFTKLQKKKNSFQFMHMLDESTNDHDIDIVTY